MNVLWEAGPQTVAQVVDALGRARRRKPAYSTILTTLRILESKGCVRHTKDGRAFVYHAVLDKKDARKNALRFILSRFFDDSPELLVQNMLDEELDAEEVVRLRRLLEDQ